MCHLDTFSTQGRRNRYGHYGHGRTTISALHLYNRMVNIAIIPLSPNIDCSVEPCSVAYPGGDLGVRTPPSASTSLIIHYSQSKYDSLHDTAQLAPAPSEKTMTGAASSRYALEVDRTSEQSAGLRAIRTVRGGTTASRDSLMNM